MVHRAKGTLLLLTLVGLVGAAPATLQAATLSELLEQGIYSEETRGDLDAAMQAYRQIIEEAKSGQPLAALAQYRLGVCHYKKEQYTEAMSAFDKLIKEYPDQKELVQMASQYMAGAVTLLPAPWVDGEEMLLDLKTPTGFKLGFVRYSAHAGLVDGRKVWRLGTILVAGPKQASRVEVDADSFQPLQSRWRHSLMGDAGTVFMPGRAEVTLQGADDVKVVDLKGVCYDSEQVIQLIRRLPLAPDYRTTLRLFVSLGSASVVPIELNVVGLETVTVPAGTFECYKLMLSAVNQTLWLSTDANRFLAKFEVSGLVGELTGVEQRQAGQSAGLDDAAFDFPLGKAGGGVPTIAAQDSQPLQNQAKILILTAVKLGQIPNAAKWCEALNNSGARFPGVPENTVFALNAQVVGRKLTSLPGNTVVFFETAKPGLNQSGGVELMAQKATGVAVAFADGRAVLVDPSEKAKLRWTP